MPQKNAHLFDYSFIHSFCSFASFHNNIKSNEPQISTTIKFVFWLEINKLFWLKTAMNTNYFWRSTQQRQLQRHHACMPNVKDCKLRQQFQLEVKQITKYPTNQQTDQSSDLVLRVKVFQKTLLDLAKNCKQQQTVFEVNSTTKIIL